MRKALFIASILIGLVGIIWLGQGIGIIHGSVMTNESKWAIIGGVMIVVAIGLFAFARKK